MYNLHRVDQRKCILLGLDWISFKPYNTYTCRLMDIFFKSVNFNNSLECTKNRNDTLDDNSQNQY